MSSSIYYPVYFKCKITQKDIKVARVETLFFPQSYEFFPCEGLPWPTIHDIVTCQAIKSATLIILKADAT